MPEYRAAATGLFPLPDWAKASLSDLKGHQKHDLVSGVEDEAVSAEYESARADVIDVQVEAGLDRVVEGQLRWDDMLAHPLAVADAVETRGLVRYYDNNNFYRDPVVVDELDASGDVAGELTAAAAVTDVPLQAVLPGPYTLADLATDEHYGDPAEFQAAVSTFLAEEVDAFPAVDSLSLLEPSLTARPPTADQRSEVERAIATVVDAFDGPTSVRTYWGAPDDETYATLLDAPIDGVGYDLVTAPERSTELVEEFGAPDAVALGVVDGQNTLVESPATVRERVHRFDSRLPGEAESVTLTPNTELFYLPVPKFEAKLRTLGEAAPPEVAA